MNRKDNGIYKVLIVFFGKMLDKYILQVVQQFIGQLLFEVSHFLQISGHPLLELEEQQAKHSQLFVFSTTDGDEGVKVLFNVWHQLMDVVLHSMVKIIGNQTRVKESKRGIRDVALIKIDIEHGKDKIGIQLMLLT